MRGFDSCGAWLVEKMKKVKVNVHPIVARLRELRMQQGMSLDKLGERAGYSGNHIWCLEHGTFNVKFNMVIDVAQALGMEIEMKEIPHDRRK